MIETYALAAIPWAILVQRFYRGFGRWLILCFVFMAIALNIFQTWQVSQAIMLSEEGSTLDEGMPIKKAKVKKEIVTYKDMVELYLRTRDISSLEPYRYKNEYYKLIADCLRLYKLILDCLRLS